MEMRHIGSRWACAAPWLLTAALFTFGALFEHYGWRPLGYLLAIGLPALLGLATLKAPAGGWLIVVGLAAGIAWGIGVILVLSLLAFVASVGGSSSGPSPWFVLAFVPIVAAIGTIMTGISERDQVRRSRAGA